MNTITANELKHIFTSWQHGIGTGSGTKEQELINQYKMVFLSLKLAAFTKSPTSF
jgi:hypothetical protein